MPVKNFSIGRQFIKILKATGQCVVPLANVDLCHHDPNCKKFYKNLQQASMSPGNVEDTSFSSSMAVQPSSANSMPQFYLTIFDCKHKEQMSPAKKGTRSSC